MPELPEVETIVQELIASKIVGKQILQVHVHWNKIIETPGAEEFIQTIKNQAIQHLERRGKYLVFTLSMGVLFVHLRMTGKFELIEKKEPVAKHEHVRLIFSDGTCLRYLDPRKFGRWSYHQNSEKKMEQLGLEPLGSQFTLTAFKKLLLERHAKIKPFLLNQKYIAGLGNIYVDEALWEAKIHPLRLSHTLTDSEIKALHQAIQHVLKKGIENLGTSLGSGQGNYYSVSGKRGGHQYQLKVFRQEGKVCQRCGDKILKIVVGQRGTHLCPTCQKEPYET